MVKLIDVFGEKLDDNQQDIIDFVVDQKDEYRDKFYEKDFNPLNKDTIIPTELKFINKFNRGIETVSSNNKNSNRQLKYSCNCPKCDRNNKKLNVRCNCPKCNRKM